ncbi:MAG TPA: HepT-like ribonuclease domain-containing protein [Roseiarcus sp.]|nr:HepT-like ribonuclease domain-containing protein [Roseiarcus sp.]
MIEAAEVCARFVTGRSRDEFEADLMLRFALFRAIEIIGEAASKVSLEVAKSSEGPVSNESVRPWFSRPPRELLSHARAREITTI